MNLRISWVVTLLTTQFVKLLISTTPTVADTTSSSYSQHNSINKQLPCIPSHNCKHNIIIDAAEIAVDVQYRNYNNNNNNNNNNPSNMRHHQHRNMIINTNKISSYTSTNSHHHHHLHPHRVDESDMSKYMREIMLENRRSQVQRQSPLKAAAMAAASTSTTTPFVILSTTKSHLIPNKRTPTTTSSTTSTTTTTTRKLIRHHAKSTTTSMTSKTKSVIYNAIENVRIVNRTNFSPEKQCVLGLKQEDNRPWSCEVKYSSEIENERPKPLFCLCSYEIDCSSSDKMYLSSEFAKQLERENHAKGVKRGAEYQCENLLKTKTNKRWTCVLKRDDSVQPTTTTKTTRSILSSTTNDVDNNHSSNKPNNDELYCDCFHKKTCKKTRMVDFF